MAVISINYDEGSKKKDLGYKSVELAYDSLKKRKIYKSGDFVKDWYDCIKFLITKKVVEKEPVMHSSTVNHFIMDGAKFNSARLKTDETLPPQLIYKFDWDDEHIEFFVKKGTKPTWEELRTLCGDPPKKKKPKKKNENKNTKSTSTKRGR